MWLLMREGTYHFAENKILRKPQKCKFGLKILILSFHYISIEKHLKFHNFLLKIIDSVEIHVQDK